MFEADFHPIDTIFAQKICPDGSLEVKNFLARLLQSARSGHMFLETSDESFLPHSLFEQFLVKEKNRIYLRRNWECENQFIEHLKRLKSQKPTLMLDISAELEQLPLNTEQKAAICKSAQNTLTLISGGPGTGKTYTAATMIRLFYEMGIKNVVIAAPTGKAVANLRRALNDLSDKCVFTTLHALVRQTRIHADLIVVDEGSMVDAIRMKELFAAVKEGARLILLGDKDQLPPIESGNFFSDLAHDQNLVAELKVCLRAELKSIVDLAESVNGRRMIPYSPLPDLKELINYVINSNVQLLTPLKRGMYGADFLNQLLYREHQKRGAREIPIMITVNDPQLNLFNGDVGILAENKALFTGGREICEHQLPHYVYAYAISVHKSQGSEYDNTLVLLPKGSEVFGKEMLYTAITRAKKQVTVLADEGVVEALLQSNRTRRSALLDNLIE